LELPFHSTCLLHGPVASIPQSLFLISSLDPQWKVIHKKSLMFFSHKPQESFLFHFFVTGNAWSYPHPLGLAKV
jgi:hypothetical protein